MRDALKKPVSLLLVCVFLAQSPIAWAEAVDDQFTQMSPKAVLGGGEFIHGTGYGKLMMRVIMFGSTQQGVHFFPEGTDLMFAVLYAGGKTSLTSLNGIKVRRRNQHEIISVDLEGLIEDGKPVPKLFDGDIVYVPWNWKADYQEVFFYVSVFASIGTLAISILTLLSIRKN